MSDDYKNLRIKEPVFEDLKEQKEEYETWSSFLKRAANALDDNE